MTRAEFAQLISNLVSSLWSLEPLTLGYPAAFRGQRRFVGPVAAADQKKVPALVTDATGLNLDYAIIVGVINDSPLIRSIIDAGKLPEAAQLRDEDQQLKWESYVIKEVADPIPGVKNALVIAGADAQGTIFGIYTISEEGWIRTTDGGNVMCFFSKM